MCRLIAEYTELGRYSDAPLPYQLDVQRIRFALPSLGRNHIIRAAEGVVYYEEI